MLSSFLIPSGPLQYVLAFLLLIVVAVSEEAMFRGYMIRRLHALTGNKAVALVAAAVIFSMGHLYQRSGGVIGVGLMGIVFGLIFIWRRSLLAPMVMHFLQDFVGIMYLPLQSTGQ